MPELPEYRYNWIRGTSFGVWTINPDKVESIFTLLSALKDNHAVYIDYATRELISCPVKQTQAQEVFKLAAQFGIQTLLEIGHYTEFSFGHGRQIREQESNNRLWAFAGKLGLNDYMRCVIPFVLKVIGANVSESNPDLWSYYQNVEKLSLMGSDGNGVKTQIKYGKLLKKVFPMASDSQIAAEVENWLEEKAAAKAPLDYFFATDRESFSKVYGGEQASTLNPDLSNGFKSLACSCMRYPASQWGDTKGLHPAEVYASGDFAIAWAEKSGKVVARCVVPLDKACNTDKTAKPFAGVSAPIYTASNAASQGLKAYIESNGAIFGRDCYDTAEAWNKAGYKLLKVEISPGKYLMPYVDSNSSAEDTGDYFQFTHRGDVDTRQTGGFVYWDGEPYRCTCCDERLSEDEYRHCDNGDTYCESCYSETFFYCERAGSECRLDDTGTLYFLNRRGIQREERVSLDWLYSNATLCEDDSEYWDSDQTICIQDEYYSPLYSDYFQSDWDCELYHDVDKVELPNGETVSLAEVKANPDWVKIEGNWCEVSETLIAPMIAAE